MTSSDLQLASLEKYLDFENVQAENPQYNNEKWVLSFQKSNVDLLFLTKCIGMCHFYPGRWIKINFVMYLNIV